MSTPTEPVFDRPLFRGLHELRRNWGWLLALGISLFLLGIIALSALPWATMIGVIYFGFLLIISGIFTVVQAFRVRIWEGFFLNVLVGILDFVVGMLMVLHTGEAAIVGTLLLAAFFFVGGLFRIAASIALRFPNWGWSVLAGVVSVVLGAAIWRRLPWDALVVIGLFIGIELLFRGWSVIMLALAVRSVPESRPSGSP
jgi:uncharacterized membrane protein HdeD (DUF308 family)